jgi:hypothetical protein
MAQHKELKNGDKHIVETLPAVPVAQWAYFKRRPGHITRRELEDGTSVVPAWMTNEDWYAWNDIVAEARCTVTMLPLFLISLHWLTRVPFVGLAGVAASMASALYHARPYRAHLLLDQLCAATLIASMLPYFRWPLLAYYAVPVCLLVCDTAQRYFAWRRRIPFLHEVWHSVPPLFMHAILAYSINQK